MADATATSTPESPAVDHQAYTTVMARLGLAGVNLNKSVDSLGPNELARMSNVLSNQGGGVDTRPGLTALSGVFGTNTHSASRLNDPQNSAFTRFWGVDTDWGRGQTVVTTIEGAFSGNPLTMAPWQSEHTGEPWMYVADSVKMRKATRTGSSLQIGLPKAAQPTAAVAEVLTTGIAAFDASDTTAAANWSAFGGTASGGSGVSAAPTLSDVGGLSGNAVRMLTNLGTATSGFPSAMTIAKAMNLTKLQAGAFNASDDDIIHIWLRMSYPTVIEEVRLYLICSPINLGSFVIPGTDPVLNQSAFMYAYRPSDYASATANTQPVLDAVLTAANNEQALAATQSAADVPNQVVPTTTSISGAAAWTEFGALGKPVRRGDFLKIGNAGRAGTDWSTITGIMILVQTSAVILGAVYVDFDDCFLTGGGNPDTSEPDSLGYDYRITNVDRRTGAESNPSDVMTTTVDALRQRISVTPQPAGDAANYYQNAWRRGGTISDDWYLVADNSAGVDGSVITDDTTDVEALASGAVEIDHDQPITTSDSAGAAVLAQAVPILFGPIEGYFLALGDPYRPGDIYWCKRFEPDHWPSANHEPVCPPAEELMNGGKYGGQGFCFSRERMYSIQVNLVDGTVSTMPTDCAEGLAGKWALDVGLGGIYFGALDAIRVTQGGASEIISDNIRPLFNGQTKNGYYPIDFTQPNRLRLQIHSDDLWFGFQDTNGSRVWWIYSFTYKTWRFYQFATGVGMAYSEPITNGGLSLILGGVTSGKVYFHSGTNDDGTAISANVRTGAMFGEERAEKLLGDLVVWAVMGGATLTAQALLNNESISNAARSVGGSAGFARYTFDTFGTTPQHADTCSIDLTWSGVAGVSPSIYKLGVGVIAQPEITMNRATAWQPMNRDGESYLTGCWVDSDTGGTARTIFVEGLLNGTPVAVATLTVNSSGGRRQWFSWSAVHVDMVRLRPSGNCQPWMLFGQGWLNRPEPPRIAVWDNGKENLGDTYYTGLDLECDTFNLPKTIQVYVDGAAVGGLVTVQANGRQLIHITLLAGRGHIYQFVATDANLGLLYSYKWLVAAEPGEQANWNQNYTIAGTLADKWLKGILLECDTFGLNKTVTVEVDGVVVSTQTVNTSGRKVVQVAFAQSLGRVFRIYPTDANPGRLYSMGWLFDEEPYQLTRFETQEQRNAIDGWQVPFYSEVSIKSTADVNMRVLSYGASGLLLATNDYTLASTAGVKAAIPVYFNAQKGVLFKFLFTGAQGFWLYKEESYVLIQPWAGGQMQRERPFGNDDLDEARAMHDAVLAARRQGGSLDG